MSVPMFGSDEFRALFPALTQVHNNYPLVYFDNAATTLKPKSMVDAVSHFYLYDSANVHRGSHFLSDRATTQFEEGRVAVQKFLGASKSNEIVFTKGTTDAINLVAHQFVLPKLKPDDEILITEMEHHSNLVPWQMIAEASGAKIKYIPLRVDGALDLEKLDGLLSAKVKFVAMTAVSNTLGTVNPVKAIAERAHSVGAYLLVDAAQAVAHQSVSVIDWGCDFLVFSAHKIFGPTGIGVLWGRLDLLEGMGPEQGGGGMIREVTYAKTTYGDVPFRFEAGTPHIAGVVGLHAALRFVTECGLESIANYEHELLVYATRALKEIKGLKIYGEAENKGPIISFLLEGVHPSDLGMILNQFGVAVRVGHHCTEPLMKKWNIPGTVRASFAPYNNKREIDHFISAINEAKKILC